mmetsp:Transcript_57782/g.151983  ORF Transcript_57782/g.151983 Transcript_57782/m.151983 type:complete len:333 (+) Transcript_57782:6238-7236(+)
MPVVLPPAPLGGVVEDDVKEDLDALPVQLPDERLEADDGRAGLVLGREALHGAEEVHRRVAPVVAELLAVLGVLPRARRLVELEDRQQLHRGDAELHEVRDLLHEAQVGPGLLLPVRDAAVAVPREAPDVRLVDDQILHVVARRLHAVPVEGPADAVVRDHPQRRVLGGAAVPLVRRVGRGHALRAGVEEPLRVSLRAALGAERRVQEPRVLDALGFEARLQLDVPGVPGAVLGRVEQHVELDVLRAAGRADGGEARVAWGQQRQQPRGLRPGRVEREVDGAAAGSLRAALRRGAAGPALDAAWQLADGHGVAHLRDPARARASGRKRRERC